MLHGKWASAGEADRAERARGTSAEPGPRAPCGGDGGMGAGPASDGVETSTHIGARHQPSRSPAARGRQRAARRRASATPAAGGNGGRRALPKSAAATPSPPWYAEGPGRRWRRPPPEGSQPLRGNCIAPPTAQLARRALPGARHWSCGLATRPRTQSGALVRRRVPQLKCRFRMHRSGSWTTLPRRSHIGHGETSPTPNDGFGCDCMREPFIPGQTTLTTAQSRSRIHTQSVGMLFRDIRDETMSKSNIWRWEAPWSPRIAR